MPLTPQHYAMLHDASAIADPIIRQRGYTSLDHPDDVQGLGFSKAQGRTAPVLAIPLWDVHGEQTGWQIRPESPRQMRDGTICKYETIKGGRVQLDVHPSVHPMLGNPQIPLWITEGVRKGDALVSAGACAIALTGGVWGFKGSNQHGGKVILPAWEHVALNGRTVYVAYDSDLHTKPGVEKALKALWTFLRSRQAIPARVQWPEAYQQTKWGVDDFLASGKALTDLLAMVPPLGPMPAAPPRRHEDGQPTWHSQLLRSPRDIPLENFSNLLLILENHEEWTGKLWFDSVRAQPMLGTTPIDEAVLVEMARWFGLHMDMPLYYVRRLELCVRAVCQQKPRDLLQEWLDALPAWDRVERLPTWLEEVASVPRTTYSMDIARLLPVSMVARALSPGCQYRYVIILEGPEDSGKSKLVRTLASPAWYREFALSMESKEAHMLLQGAWIAELGELASLSRTEEARLKSFITLEEDVWIPKYSNFVQRAPRRTVFIGTVNPEEPYLKGQTGNTRFLPVQTGVIDGALLEAMRDQLFAEALLYWRAHPEDWWQLSADARTQAIVEREGRRQTSVFEDDLEDWLTVRRFGYDIPLKDTQGRLVECTPGVTSWEEIAQHYLRIEPDKWKDKALQMQIAQAMRANAWERVRLSTSGSRRRVWQKMPGPPQ